MAFARGVNASCWFWLAAPTIFLLGLSWLPWVGPGPKSTTYSVCNHSSLTRTSENWQPFFRGAILQDIPSVPRGQLLEYCHKKLDSSTRSGNIVHTSGEHVLATSVSTLAQVQVAQPLLKVCLVQQDCASCNQGAGAHVDPQMFASKEVCQDLVARVYTKQNMNGRGFDIARLCGQNVTSQWCRANAGNQLRCNSYQVHSLPKEVPVVAAFPNAYITSVGHVYVDNFIYKPVGPCLNRNEAELIPNVERHKEVVVATAFWGDALYHALIENLPRLMVVWDDLLARPEVHIAAGANKAMAEYLEFMGISKDRIKAGNMMADIAYVPNPGGCGGSPGHRYVQELRERMHTALKSRLPGLMEGSNAILVIQRSGGTRRIGNHQELVDGIRQQFPLAKLEIFQDNPPPTLLELARMFYSAKVIIAPHGAGLSNIVLASNRAVVIELLIVPVNPCYMDLARDLGNQWHGLHGHAQSQADPMHVNVQDVLGLVGQVL